MKTLILLLLTPPGCALVLALAALLLWNRRPSLSYKFLLVSVLVGWVFSTMAMGRVVSTVLISEIKGPSPRAMDDVNRIIVLTAGLTFTGETGWQPTPDSFQRAAVAYEVQSRIGSRTPLVISGGHTMGPKYPSEAEVVRRAFDRYHAQITPVIVEEASLNTYESALESARLLRDRDVNSFFLVTSEVHMLRSLAAYRGRGLDPIPFPVFSLDRGPLELTDFLPTWRGVETNAKALYEVIGIAGYLLSGYARWEDVFYKP